MTSEVWRLRERVAEAPERVDPAALADAIRADPTAAETASETLERLATAGHGRAATMAVADCLSHEDEAVRECAATALSAYVDEQPDAPQAVTDALVERFDDDYYVVRKHAAAALRAIALERPEAAVATLGALDGLLDDDRPALTELGLDLLEIALDTDTEAADDSLRETLLSELLARSDLGASVLAPEQGGDELSDAAFDQYDTHTQRRQTNRNRLAGHASDALLADPGSVGRHLDLLLEVIDTVDAGAVRAPLIEAIGHASTTDPSGLTPAIAPICARLEDVTVDTGVAASAAWTLGILADPYGERVADAATDHVEALRSLLADDEFARTASAGLLGYVCEYRPEVGSRVTDDLATLLDDDNSRVRAAAALALGYAGADETAPALQALETDDPDKQVRATAAEALDLLDR